MENAGPVGSGAAGILEAGTRLGKYEIRRLIGLGSTSAIYEGARPDTGRRVAIKVLSPKRAGLPGGRARFLAEAKLTARVRHAHLVDVIEIGEDGEQIYLVMELLEGEDLGHRLRHSGPLSAAETTDVLVPVCEAVAAAHDSGIVHRDLKPSNIFLAIRDQKTRPVVLDFGIADHHGAAGAEAGTVEDAGAVSGPRLLFGTPYYLSPEQIADHRATSPATDQWALGVILYECLTGARPYDGDSLDDLLRAIAAGNARPPSERRPGLSPELDRVVMRAMSSDPKGRFASVTELAQALRPFRSGGAEARTPSRRRAPSSPSIVAEASTQSLFARTLTPEVDVLDGLWFEPEPAEETSDDVMFLPAHSSSEAESTASAERLLSSEAKPTFGSLWIAAGRRALSRRALRRRSIGAAAGGALGGLALVLLLTHVGSGRGGGAQRTVTVRAQATEQGASASAIPPVGPVIAAPAEPDRHEPEKESPAAKEAAITREPAAPTSLAVAQEPTPPKKTVAPAKEPAAEKEPTAMEPEARPPVTAAALRSSTTERRVRAPRPPTEAPAAPGAAAHDVAERPRARPTPEVRTHNGVPLLD